MGQRGKEDTSGEGKGASISEKRKSPPHLGRGHPILMEYTMCGKWERVPHLGRKGSSLVLSGWESPHRWGKGRSNLHLGKEMAPHMRTKDNSPGSPSPTSMAGTTWGSPSRISHSPRSRGSPHHLPPSPAAGETQVC